MNELLYLSDIVSNTDPTFILTSRCILGQDTFIPSSPPNSGVSEQRIYLILYCSLIIVP